MAKKRKQRSSEPAAVQTTETQVPDEQLQPPQPIIEEEVTQYPPKDAAEDDVVEQQEEAHQIEEDKEQEGLKQEQVQEEEGEEGQGVEKEENDPQTEDPSSSKVEPKVEANGANEFTGDVNGNERHDEEEDDEDVEPLEKLLEPFGKDQLVVLLRKAVDKHPDLMDSVREIADADPAHRKIFVHGLGWDTTAETLKSEFGKYGEIEDCKAVVDRVSKKSKGYAFILFKHRVGARRALKQPQKRIGNRFTSCQLATMGPVPSPMPAVPQTSEYTQRKIFVSNVSADLDPEKLLQFFSQFGEVEEGPLGLDKQTGRPKGFALFVYKYVEGAKKALEEPHKKFEGHTLHCQKAIDGPKQNKIGYGGAGHHQPHHHQSHHHQQHYHHTAKKGKHSSNAAGTGHLMAPSGPSVSFNPGIPSQGLNPAIGQALTALIATQGAGLGLGNLLGGLGGGPVNQGGPPAGYGTQIAGGFVSQPTMQGGYNPQMNPHLGQTGTGRPQQGGGPYMGH